MTYDKKVSLSEVGRGEGYKYFPMSLNIENVEYFLEINILL